ncbi:flagellin [Halomonas sp. SCS19]|uniref:flagellin N-terminal helical domain-containing protein n=1 Tax=Halomonas sp. SCS19 TaxID=2950870 RepID=UPI0032DFE7B4
MSVINTNITSMIGQQNLNASKSALTTSMERLSSGLRINSAKDDAAGQAIANRMSAQITGLSQAQRNANDGISVAQTAEGALNQVNDNLQRIRELSVQAQNDTNSADDLSSIQDEIGQRLDEIDRISKETNFNGVEVLNTNEGVTIQVGANDGESISVNLQTINAETLGLSSFSVQKAAEVELGEEVLGSVDTGTPTGPSGFDLSTVDLSGITTDGDGSVDASSLKKGTDGSYYVTVSGSATANQNGEYAVTFDEATGELTDVELAQADVSGNTMGGGSSQTLAAGSVTADTVYQDADGQKYVKVTGSDAGFQDGFYAIADSDINDDGSVNVDVSSESTPALALSEETNLTKNLDTSGLTASQEVYQVELEDGSSQYVVKDGEDLYAASVDGTGAVSIDTATYTDAAGATQQANVRFGGIDGETKYAQVDVQRDGETVTANFAVTGDATNGYAVDLENEIAVEGTDKPLAALDDALKQVDSLRSELGAVQNRFDSAITNLSTTETNLSAARSRIEDADYADEVSNMTRAQILQQAGTSVLAQANQVPQSVLSLLG